MQKERKDITTCGSALRLACCNFNVCWSKLWSQSLSVGVEKSPKKRSGGLISVQVGRPRCLPWEWSCILWNAMNYAQSGGASGGFEDLWPFLRYGHCFSGLDRLSQLWLIKNQWKPSGLQVNVPIPRQGVFYTWVLSGEDIGMVKSIAPPAGSASYWPFPSTKKIIDK